MSVSSSKAKKQAISGVMAETWKRLAGFILILLVAFPVLSIASYTCNDVPWIHAESNQSPSNLIGLAGAVGTWLGYGLFGVGLWMLPVWMVLFGVFLMTGHSRNLGWRLFWALVFQAGFCGILQLFQFSQFKGDPIQLLQSGGAVGWFLMDVCLKPFVGAVGGVHVLLLLMILAVIFGVGWKNWGLFFTFCSYRWKEACLRRMDEASRIDREARLLNKKLAAQQKQAKKLARAEQVERKREEAKARKEERLAEKRRDQLARDQAYEAEKARIKLQREQEKAAEKAARDAIARKRSEEAQANADEDEEQTPIFNVSDDGSGEASTYVLPTIDLLASIPEKTAVSGDVEANKALLVDTFQTFNLKVEVTSVEVGPVITTYEILPAPGIKPETIANMAKSIEMRLKATSIRIEAPIPGKGVCGIEIPNAQAGSVSVREILEGPIWYEATRKMRLPMLLGKDSSGHDLVCDLASMPHLLVAGATGSGKSVCMNAILTGLLMSRTPDQLRLMLIDPKEVEFSGYNSIPHLVTPIITDAKKVSLGLVWAIHEMEKRYKMLSTAGVKNIEAFNRRKLVQEQPVQGDLFNQEGEEEKPLTPQQKRLAALPDHLPYIVIVIDELSDLMLQVGREIDDSISRLAAKARAAGIHLILATQRPDVKVVTGTIKANIPGRIAFQVASQVDSRTIIDRMGAESLLGHGDMLFLNPRAGRPVRAQGAFITDEDAEAVASYIRQQGGPRYMQEVQDSLDGVGEEDGGSSRGGGSSSRGGGNGSSGSNRGENELYEQALDYIRRSRRASTSSLQRQFHIGYSKAAGILDLMEERGIVGPPRGANPREILVDLDGEIPVNDDGGCGENGEEAAADSGTDGDKSALNP